MSVDIGPLSYTVCSISSQSVLSLKEEIKIIILAFNFPYIYKAVSQSTYINKDTEVLWCANTPNFDMDNMWGYC